MNIFLNNLHYTQPAAVPPRKENQNTIRKNSVSVSRQFDSIVIHGDAKKVEPQDFSTLLTRSLSKKVATETASPERIKELTEQVAAGTYVPDPYAIASKIMLEGGLQYE